MEQCAQVQLRDDLSFLLISDECLLTENVTTYNLSMSKIAKSHENENSIKNLAK